MLIPLKLKYKKYHKQKINKLKNNVCFKLEKKGFFFIQALENGLITPKQIEAVRKCFSKFFKKKAKFWITCYPNIPLTRKSKNIRMGRGKGSVKYYIYKLLKGDILFEIEYYYLKEILKIFLIIKSKLPIKIRLFYSSFYDKKKKIVF